MKILIKESQYKVLLEQSNPFPSITPKTTRKYLQQVPKECSSKWQPQLEKAKNYWIKWLSSPITRIKFLNNWQKVEKNMTLVEVGNIVNEEQVNGAKVWKENTTDISKMYLYLFNNYWHTNYKAYQEGNLLYNIDFWME